MKRTLEDIRYLPGELRAPCDWCYPCYTCRDLMQDAADEIDRLNALFGGRFHLDSKCGSCGGPLECDRDAICHRCTDALEIEQLQAIVDRIQKDADGNPILPGDAGFALRFPALGGKPHIIQMRVDTVEIACIRSWKDGTARPENFYRSREAAEKARNP